jgi:hypothetical protein
VIIDNAEDITMCVFTRLSLHEAPYFKFHNGMDLINTLPGDSSVNVVQHATIEEVVFSVNLTDVPIDWLDSVHVMCLL